MKIVQQAKDLRQATRVISSQPVMARADNYCHRILWANGYLQRMLDEGETDLLELIDLDQIREAGQLLLEQIRMEFGNTESAGS